MNQTPPARAPEAVTVPLDGGTVLYHRRTGEVHRLDAVGSIVWQFLDGQNTVDELVADLAVAFEVDPGVVRGDIGNLLVRLRRAGLLADGAKPEVLTGPRLLTNPPSP
jgi:PqqD family protein of HPr-rel-A system